jgi:uncharacterized membrane protein (UPF0182 family)
VSIELSKPQIGRILSDMSEQILDDSDFEVIDITPKPKLKRRWRLWIILAIILVSLLSVPSLIGIYVNSLWFESLGYSPVYWFQFKLTLTLFFGFTFLTFFILRGAFWLIERSFVSYVIAPRKIVLNPQQTVMFDPSPFLKPVAWVISIIFAVIYGFSFSGEWQTFALYQNQQVMAATDPIFNKSVSFYLFTLPFYELLNDWFFKLTIIILAAAVVYSLLTFIKKDVAQRKTRYKVISGALSLLALTVAFEFYLDRYTYLWRDHQTVTGVTYTEYYYALPGLFILFATLLVSAVMALINAFVTHNLRVLMLAVALPVAVFLVGVVLIPGYIQSFIVKPNELDRETPFIEYNIASTRAAFQLEQIESQDFQAETTTASFDIEKNRATVDNIRLWDRPALQATLKQLQEIRNYYDFTTVDVDRYKIDGQKRLMMMAARELDVNELPGDSRKWVNQRLIYTHGYGLTMNTANGFTAEGRPQFVLSNMPIQSTSADIKVTRPQIYYGQKTDSDVYVNTKQNEFDFPQSDSNTFTTYEGTGGIGIGGSLRRLALAWELGDLTKLSFSDDVTSESRVLMRRNIMARVKTIAPFLIYDDDPYIVVDSQGKLSWIIDAFTSTEHYPYSHHYQVQGKNINYLRNSVKITVDAYNGDVNFYVFDEADELLKTYQNMFPTLFQPAGKMPADLREHIRFPETLLKTQGEAFGLYHTTNPKIFFQREDVWTLASLIVQGQNNNQPQPLQPYFALTQLPNSQDGLEFVKIVTFTPAGRNNLIAIMAGRSDGDAYGKLMVYTLPKSRFIDGPIQIEARIDQDPTLSGQFTLWNQQGSKMERGNLMVIPVGHGLLYVQPIYLQAVQSPMPELRMVVLATQEKISYGPNFASALSNMFGESAGKKEEPKETKPDDKKETTPTTVSPNAQQLINQAAQEFADYQQLTSQGKYAEAGKKLEDLKRSLEELKKSGVKQ